MPLETRANLQLARRPRPAAAVHAGEPARSGRRLCACHQRSRPSRAPARWSMSAASISPNSPSCWSRRSRCDRRGARSMPAWRRWPTRWRRTRRRRRPITFDWPDAMSRQSRARRRRPPGLAARRHGERAAGLAGVRRHDPHRGDGRGSSRVCDRFRRRWRRKASDGCPTPTAGGELRAPSHGRDRRLAGARLWRGRARVIWRGLRPRRACAATSTTTAISWCGASGKGDEPSARRCCRVLGQALLARSGRAKGPRAMKLSAHHPARSLGHLRVRARGRARRMGGVRRLRVLGSPIRLRSKARRARLSAAGSSASRRSAGRRWCRSSRRARTIARRWSRCWRSSWSSASARPTWRRARRGGRGSRRSRPRSATSRRTR